MKEDVWIKTTCNICFSMCAIRVHRVDGQVVEIEGNPDCPTSRGGLCPRGASGIMLLYDPNRVNVPLKRTNPEKGFGIDPEWVEITWEEAFDILVEKLSKIHEKNPLQLYAGSMDVHVCGLQALFTSAFTGGDPRVGYFAGYGGFCGEPIHRMGTALHGSFLDYPETRYSKYIIVTAPSKSTS